MRRRVRLALLALRERSKLPGAASLILAATLGLALPASAQPYTEATIYGFTGGSDGVNPWAAVIQATDGNLYGTTYFGGSHGAGTVFRITNPTTSPTESVIYNFTGGSDGWNPPYGSLIQASDGNLYGTTAGGGPGGYGTVFKISNLAGTPTESVIYGFLGGTDGSGPNYGVIQASDGNLYGTTFMGGANGLGNVFKISNLSTSPTESVVYSFSGGTTDGAFPQSSVIQASDGNLYGTTTQGGSSSAGTVFKISNLATSPTESVIHSFAGGSDGSGPWAPVIQATDGNLYGTTNSGGSVGAGTVFKITNPTTSPTESVIHSFAAGTSDGSNPEGPVIQASDGNLYGTTIGSGANGDGTVFEITNPSGSATEGIIHSFAGVSDGRVPFAGLFQAPNGTLYGTTSQGGAADAGVVFRIGGVCPLIRVGPSSLPNGQVGGSYNQTVFALGGAAPVAFSVTAGGLPPGLSLNSASGALTGTLTTSGTYLLTVAATDANGCTGSQAYTIVVNASGCLGIVVSPSTLPDGQVGISYSQTVAGNDGTAPYTFSLASGALPPGLSLNPATGNITGTPTTSNAYGFTILATDANSCSGTRDYSIDIAPAGVITVSAISPECGSSAGGDTVTITGSFFQSGAAVWIAGQPATGVTVLSATQITAITPANTPGTVGDVLVTNPNTTYATIRSGFGYDFLDVPASNPFHNFICRIAREAITGGCGGGDYCPGNSVLRSQMAIFLLRGEHGATFIPPAAVGIFGDVPMTNPFAPWIERLYGEGITGGCSTNPLNYCPGNPVSRAGMAVFLLVAQHGTGYVPPACTGIFADVACPGPFTNWIEQLYNEGVTGGCNTNPLMYCPSNPVNRASMAVFLTVTFGLQ